MRATPTLLLSLGLIAGFALGTRAASGAPLGPSQGFESAGTVLATDSPRADASGAWPVAGSGFESETATTPADASAAQADHADEDPFAATYHFAEPEVDDPWQPFNRRMYRFNRAIDSVVFKPVAKGYSRFTPRVLRLGVSQFFDNLQEPVVSLNLLLQGKLKMAGASLGRFLLNSTLGLGGVLDPASHAKIPNPRADFGQTFAVWGWRKSRYVVLPLFGPATMRDTWGKGVNTTVSPIDWLARREGAEISLLYGIDARASALPAESLLADAEDEYAMVRDVYLQYRRCQIVDCSEELPEYLLPDYEFEIPNIDAETLRR